MYRSIASDYRQQVQICTHGASKQISHQLVHSETERGYLNSPIAVEATRSGLQVSDGSVERTRASVGAAGGEYLAALADESRLRRSGKPQARER